MMYYKALVGSNSYGMAVEQSDRDVLLVSDECHESGIRNGLHTIAYTPETFLNKCPLPAAATLPYHIQWLFPGEFLADTALSRYALEIREELVLADRKRIYQGYMDKAAGLGCRLEELYNTFPKRGAYGCLFYDTIVRFAQGTSFAQACRPDEDLRQWLLAVRRREIPVEELVQRYNKLRGKAQAVGGFYDKETDSAILADAEAEMLRLLGLENTRRKEKHK